MVRPASFIPTEAVAPMSEQPSTTSSSSTSAPTATPPSFSSGSEAVAPKPPATDPPAPSEPKVDVNALLAQVEELRSQLHTLGASGVPAPEPRFKTIGSLFRELARNTLTGDVLHEFLTIVDRIEDAVPEAAAVEPAPVG